jgi:hypothetical protein
MSGYIHEILISTVEISGVAVILLGFISGVSVMINLMQQANTYKLRELVESWKYQAENLQSELNASRNGHPFNDGGV